MQIKELTENYRKRFDAHTKQVQKMYQKNGKATQKVLDTPNYVKEVILPVIKSLAQEMPDLPVVVPDPQKYALYGDHYRIKVGIRTVGGLSFPTGGDHNLYFTPLWHGQPCGAKVRITQIDKLVKEINKILTQS